MRKRHLPEANPQVRPVGARALKSAIDTLRPYLFGCEALDLFAGQGRFGGEALKEGATRVVFVEKDRGTAQALREAISKFSDRSDVQCKDALLYLEMARRQSLHFDVVFADPPFPLWNTAFQLSLFGAVAACLSPGAIFLVKHKRRMVASVTFPGLSLWKDSLFGESRLIYYRYGESEAQRETPREETSDPP